MSLVEYPKIYSPYKRHVTGPDKNKFMIGNWTKPEFEYLANTKWLWTEKVDGTNIRVHWDGHKVEFAGRTERAQIQATLMNRLNELFTEEIFEQTFQDTEVILFGEGYGAGIQKGGGNYVEGKVQDFVLFDVLVGRWWLLRDAMLDIAFNMGLAAVPLHLEGTVYEAIEYVKEGVISDWGNFIAEGLVGVTAPGLVSRDGHRLQMKVKTKDFQ